MGVATQEPRLVRGLVVDDKTRRVANFHHETVHACLELLGAAGLHHPSQLTPWHIHRRVSQTRVKSYAQILRFLEPGDLPREPLPERYRHWMRMATPDSFCMDRRCEPARV